MKVIGCAMKVHAALGPGLPESSYRDCLRNELDKAGLEMKKEVPVPFIHQAVPMHCGYRADLIVNNRLLVEIKSVDCISQLHIAQALTCLQLTGIKSGIIINFNIARLKDGLRRIAR